VVRDNYGDERPCTLDADELDVLAKGARLLGELLPLLSRSALSHAHLVTVFPEVGAWASRLSSSEFRISGTVFLSRRLLSNPWRVAEHLFHEALHQQIYDFRAGHSVLIPNFVREDAPTVHSLWNRPDSARGNYWDIHRALAALHVYVHLALLASAAEQGASQLVDEYGPVTLTGRRTSLARAHYLAEQIRELGWQELGPAGRQFLDWFSSVLELLDSSPPAPGAYVHLLLDRYWREARDIRSLPGDAGRRAELPGLLSKLTDEEVGRTRRVLDAMGEDVARFNEDVAAYSGQDPLTRFASVRTLIANTILNAAPRSFILSESKAPDEMVKQMVEQSSAILQPLFAN
jgi:hypothetical protein